MAYRHPLAFLLGLEGVALLRALVDDDFDGRLIDARITETRELLDRAAPELGDGIELGELGTEEGYRAWSATYDQPGNPMIDLEQALVRQILDRLPPGRALDAACGTGRHGGYLSERGHQVTGVDSSPFSPSRGSVRSVVELEPVQAGPG